MKENTATSLGVSIIRDTSERDDLLIISGGRHDNPTWEEYKSEWKEKYHHHWDILRKAVESSDFYKVTADKFCNDHHFEFTDGEKWAFTWRAWGDFMSVIVGKKEGYMKYYM